MNSKSKISALLITYNEIDHIQEVIENISFADEIIVVDSGSTDGTLDILKKYSHVKVIINAFKNFTDQRNFTLKQATHNWILFIDADERITPNLKEEILKVVKSKTQSRGFMVRRQYFFREIPIRYSGYQSDTTYRLFKNGFVKYDESRVVHEIPIINGKSEILESKMLHYSYTSNADLKRKMMHYGLLKGKQLFEKGKKANAFHFIIKPTYKFLYNYIIRLGFLDGKLGLEVCYFNAYSVYYRYKTLKKLEKERL